MTNDAFKAAVKSIGTRGKNLDRDTHAAAVAALIASLPAAMGGHLNATPALQTGKLMQFTPIDREPERGLYIYFRYDEAKTVMVVLNFSNEDKTLITNRFEERMKGFSRARNILTGGVLSDLTKLKIGKNAPLILELEP